MASNPGTVGLISWWELNEESGTRVDSHASNDLTDNNTVLFNTGKQGNAADFESGSSESLSISDASQSGLRLGDNDWSICAWVQAETFPGDASIVVKQSDAAATQEYRLYYKTSATEFALTVYDGVASSASVDASTFGTPATGTWYFVYGEHKAGATNTVGISVNAGTIDTAADLAVNSGSTADFHIGARAHSTQRFWDGEIDEVAIFSRALSQAEIDWLYNSGSGRAYADLTAGGQPIQFFT